MGTRNLTVVISGKEPKIAQYGQWDGYPGGQGVTALEFLRVKKNQKALKAKLKDCTWVAKEEVEAEIGSSNGWMNEEQSKKFREKFPYLTRDHGAKILELVAGSNHKPIKLMNSFNFAAYSLFCEWAYVVDFDTNVFEVYKGFNTRGRPRNGRFSKLPIEPKGKHEDASQYYPIRLVKSFKLSRLPSEKVFLSSFEGSD